jgi:RNA polymerase sigma-70 factor (ECF subfamily)
VERDADTSDEELMLAYAGGDAAAFERLYTRHRGGLYRYITRQCGERGAAEEMFQDVWVGVVQARQRYRPEARFATWLYTLAHNRLVDWYRRAGRVHWVAFGSDGEDTAEDDPPAARTALPEVQAESRQLAARLLTLLDDLPPPQREAFLLHEEGGLSLEEIAAATGCSLETAKSRLRYALSKLRRGLADELTDTP